MQVVLRSETVWPEVSLSFCSNQNCSELVDSIQGFGRSAGWYNHYVITGVPPAALTLSIACLTALYMSAGSNSGVAIEQSVHLLWYVSHCAPKS